MRGSSSFGEADRDGTGPKGRLAHARAGLHLSWVWYPLQLERMTLATRLSAAECRDRLLHTTSPLLGIFDGGIFPVRGLVRGTSFYFGRSVSHQNPPRTWMSGRIRDRGPTTFIHVRIGPNPLSGIVSTVLFSVLAAGAVIATLLALTSPFRNWQLVALSWAVVITFVGLFFVLPAADHPIEREFLLEHLVRTLEAAPVGEARGASPTKSA
jgi:hypothetical protein